VPPSAVPNKSKMKINSDVHNINAGRKFNIHESLSNLYQKRIHSYA
jgi:hypothetical protein